MNNQADNHTKSFAHIVLFRCPASGDAVAASFVVFHHAGVEGKLNSVAMWTVVAAVMYFVANTVPVAAVIALSSSQKASKVWSDFFLWTFPYYAMGTGVSAILLTVNATAWIALMPTVVVAYAVYRSYTMFASRMETTEPQRSMAASAGH